MTKKENVSKLVEYQKGTVVSRTIINKPAGTVTLFAFDQSQGLSQHTAPYDALVYLLDGQAEIIIAGQKHKLSAGEMIIMPAGEPHALKAEEKFKMMLIMIKQT
ncbi:MAG: cupin domain-containing protein [Parcubacteria group bacterium]|nr:cupin domain-containing protein [Parcubacteria group bacterium]